MLRIEMGEVGADVLAGDLRKGDAVVLPAQPSQIAGEVVAVGLERAGGGSAFSGERIEPQLPQTSIGGNGGVRSFTTSRLGADGSPRISCCGTPELREGLQCLEQVGDAPQA